MGNCCAHTIAVLSVPCIICQPPSDLSPPPPNGVRPYFYFSPRESRWAWWPKRCAHSTLRRGGLPITSERNRYLVAHQAIIGRDYHSRPACLGQGKQDWVTANRHDSDLPGATRLFILTAVQLACSSFSATKRSMAGLHVWLMKKREIRGSLRAIVREARRGDAVGNARYNLLVRVPMPTGGRTPNKSLSAAKHQLVPSARAQRERYTISSNLRGSNIFCAAYARHFQ